MQTKRESKNRTKTIRWNRQGVKSLHRAKSSPQSSIASKAIGGAVFRPDLLDFTITNKSGSFVPELGFDENPFEDKSQVIENWYRTLKNHPKIKELKVDENASLDDVLILLKQTTDNLFKGYDWILKSNELMESFDIYYYKRFDEVYMIDMPLEWIDKQKNPLIRELCMYMIKGLSQKFHIDRIKNEWTYYELDEFNSEGEVIEYIRENCGDEVDFSSHELYIAYMLYEKGAPSKLESEFKRMNFSIKVYAHRLELIKDSHKRIYNWLKLGLELLNDDFKIHDFDFDPYNVPDENSFNEAVPLGECFWFPYSDRDHLYDKAMMYFDDNASNCGINAAHEYGYLKADSFRTPVSHSKLNKLIKFFIRGNKINPLKRKNR